MSQGIFSNIDPYSTTGIELADILNDFKDSVASGHSGATRPVGLLAGGMWVDTSASPDLALKFYDGTDDIDIATINSTTNVVTYNGIDLGTIESDIDTLQTDVSDLQTDLSDHIADTSTHGITSTIVGTDETQTLTNKTLTAPIISSISNTGTLTLPTSTDTLVGRATTDTLANKTIGDALGFIELSSTPSTPSSGTKKLYAKDDGKVYTLDSTGEEKEVGSGSGSGFGGKNYFVDPSFSEDVVNARVFTEVVATDAQVSITPTNTINVTHPFTDQQELLYYSDGNAITGLTAGTKVYAKVIDPSFFQVSLTPGGAAISLTAIQTGNNYTFRGYGVSSFFTTSVETTSPQAGEGSLKLTFTDAGGSAVGQGVELETTTIDAEDRGKEFYLRVHANNVDTDYVDNDLIFKVIDSGSGRPVGLYSSYQLKRLNQDYLIPISTSVNSAKLYVSVQMAADNATGNFDTIFGTWSLGPDLAVVGDSIITEYVYNTSGLTTAGASNTTSFATGTAGAVIGSIASTTTTGNSLTAMRVRYSSANNFETDSFDIEVQDTANNSPFISVGVIQNVVDKNHRETTAEYGVGINRVIGSTTDVDVFFGNAGRRNNNASYGGAGSAWSEISTWRWRAVRRRVVKNTYSTTELMFKGAQVTATKSATSHTSTGNWQDVPWTETRDTLGEFDGTLYTAKESGLRIFNGNISTTANATGERIVRLVNSAGTVLGEGAYSIGYASSPSRLPFAIPVYMNANDTAKIQVYQSSGGSLAYTTSGSVLGIFQVFDPKIYGAYGERKSFPEGTYSSNGLVNYAITAGQYGDLASVTLSPGKYTWTINSVWNGNGATTTTNVGIGISTTSGNSSTGLIIGETSFFNTKTTTAGSMNPANGKSTNSLVITTPTTYYLKGFAGSSITNLQVGWSWRFDRE